MCGNDVFCLIHSADWYKSGDTSETQAPVETTEWTGATAPNFLGKTLDEVNSEVKNQSNITIKRSYSDDFSDDYKEGTVMHQSPAAGERVTDEDLAQGFIITVTISKGPRMRELPNIEGSPLKEASETIAAQGLLGTVEYQYSDKYNEGIVVGYKDKSVGETVEYGTNITLIVSKGKEPIVTQSN